MTENEENPHLARNQAILIACISLLLVWMLVLAFQHEGTVFSHILS